MTEIKAPPGSRFTAKIVVEFRAAGSDALRWSGSIERDHDVEAHEYMHTGRASIAMLAAFRNLLSGFPLIQKERAR